MKKKLLTLLMVFSMLVTAIPGISAVGVQSDDPLRNPNRYYYVTEYTDYVKEVTITITEADAAYNELVKEICSEGIKRLTFSDVSITGAITNAVLQQVLSLAYNNNPTARVGDYNVKIRYKTKYKIDSLDPTNKVATDKWVEFLFDYKGDSKPPYAELYRLK